MNAPLNKQKIDEGKVDGQKSRSLSTQQSLREAAEKLIAKKGIQNVSIKEIVRVAGQKNESALQYHFKNLQGLIDAIHVSRTEQTQSKRAVLLAEMESTTSKIEIRDLCRLMVMPTFELSQEDPGFRRYLTCFSHEIALAPDSALTKINRTGGGGKSGRRTGELLRGALRHLDEPTYRQRMDIALRACSAAMGHHAKQKNGFKGQQADLFVSNLVDMLEGMLSAPVSSESRSIAKSL